MTKPASAIPSVPIVKTSAADAGREIEVKFRTDRDSLKRAQASQVLASVSAPRTESVRSTYFDTASGDLRKSGIVLRIRRKGRGKPILGVKATQTDNGPFSRKEVEVPSPDMQPDLSLFDEATASELSALLGIALLRRSSRQPSGDGRSSSSEAGPKSKWLSTKESLPSRIRGCR